MKVCIEMKTAAVCRKYLSKMMRRYRRKIEMASGDDVAKLPDWKQMMSEMSEADCAIREAIKEAKE